MAYDFLGLVNDVNRRLNEVELTSANFSAAKGFYQQAKDSVNTAIQDINQQHFEWPFNHVTQDETLTAGITRYGLPTDVKTVDFDTFRIKENSTLGNDTVKLQIMSYEDYLERFVDQEYTSNTSVRGIPKYVFRTPNQEYGLAPVPDKAYRIVYEYYRNTVSLELATDVPTIPEIYRHVIVDGAMYHAYMFRGNSQDALIAKRRFDDGVKNMRVLLINRYDYVRSTAIQMNRHVIAGYRVG